MNKSTLKANAKAFTPPKKTQQVQKKEKRQQRQGQRVRQQPKTQVFETKKQAKADPRIGTNGMTLNIASQNQVRAAVLTHNLEQSAIQDYARGIVMKACEKGFAAYAEQYDPYFAYIYMVNTIIALINNQQQLSVNVPYALLAMARGLRAKSVPMANSSASYATVVFSQNEPAQTEVLGYGPYGNVWSIQTIGGGLTNIIWPRTTPVITAYTAELGAASFQRMMQILVDPEVPASRSVLTTTRTVMDNDVSSFAYSRRGPNTLGLVSAGPGDDKAGGVVTTLDLEVPIRRPQFAATSSSIVPDNFLNRFGALHANVMGDGTTLGAGQLSWFDEKKWLSQRPPKLHFVDFNEFVDVLGKWVANIQQAFVNDETNAGTDPATVVCPLTLQEMKLVLRNVLMTAFKETQASVHSVYPLVPASGNDNKFVPFLVGVNTCYLAANPLQLPIPLIENIRALVYRYIQRSDIDYECFIPVLGQFYDDTPLGSDYSFTLPGQEIPTLSFQLEDAVFKKKVPTKSGEAFAPMAEIAISMIDGSSSEGLVYINNPFALKETTAKWNEWLKKTGLESYSIQCGILGTEKGINALTSVNMSRIAPLPIQENKTNSSVFQHRRTDILDTRERKLHASLSAPSSIYANRIVVVDTSQSVIVSTAYEQVQSVWILPGLNADYPNQVFPTKWQAVTGEGFSQSLGEGGVTLESLHANYAANMTKGKLAQGSDWAELFKTLAEHGRGGILSGIVSRFADAIIPGAGGIVTTIGNAIGV